MACFAAPLFRASNFVPSRISSSCSTNVCRPPRRYMMATATRAPADEVKGRSELIFLGTGCSTGLPLIGCTLPRAGGKCAVCMEALRDPSSPNRRCNASALIRVGDSSVLIDCGKTFRETALRHFNRFGVDDVDGIVVTHAHADAYFGLDDVRDIQRGDDPPMPVYVSKHTMAVCRKVYPYLMPKPIEPGVERWVAAIDWTVFPETLEKFHPFPANETISFTPVPLLHGGTFVCWGFLIDIDLPGTDRNVVAYLSDVHEIPPETWEYLESFEHINVLIVDALGRRPYHSHFCLDQAVGVARRLRPGITRCVGMGHSLEHRATNAELERLQEAEGLDVQLAHDGLVLPL